ncbi:MAG: sigma-70 family RNA polymerase sigma factor [Actinobacteria bacterium]|nr:sigma-70 family RNA polymerase sigma factor [Actinomycetota bacterium]
MEITDRELAVLAGRGDAEAYRRLFERYQHPVYNFVYRLVDNAADASDIVQDAFIRMYSVLGERDIQNFSAYLYRTAKNLAYDEMRRRSRFVDVDEEMLTPEDPNIYADPQRALLLGEQMETVRRAARGLNENQRAALILRELEELDYDQMADVLESNRNAVGALLSRARLKFREELRMAQIQTESCPPDCEEVIALLSPYIDGELQAAEKDMVESHLEGCTFCLAALEEMNEASRSFRMFIPVIPPAGLAQAFTGRLGEIASGGAGDMGQYGSEEGVGEAGQAGSGHGAGDSGAGMGEAVEPLDATRIYSGQPGSGPSKFARMLRRPAFWISALAAIMILGAAAALTAELTGGSDAGDREATGSSRSSTMTATVSTQDSSSGAVSSTTETTAGVVVDDTATAGDSGTSTGNDTGSTTTPEPQSAPLDVISGSASPNPVYQGGTVKYSAKISGDARTATLTLVSDYDGSSSQVSLALQSSSGGIETWGASGTAGAPQGYHLYVTATDAAGEAVQGYVGMLSVYP